MKEKREQQLHNESERGARAKELLENATFRDAFDSVEKTLLERLIAAPVRDAEGVHELKLMIQLLRTVQGHLIKHAQTGRMADQELSRWEQVKQRAKRAMGG